MDLSSISSNWNKLKTQLKQSDAAGARARATDKGKGNDGGRAVASSLKRKQSAAGNGDSKKLKTSTDKTDWSYSQKKKKMTRTGNEEQKTEDGAAATVTRRKSLSGPETSTAVTKAATTRRRTVSGPGSSADLESDISRMNIQYTPPKENGGLSPTTGIGRYIAIDCEMVGVGPIPDNNSSLARVSMVNYDGEQIYDSFVKQREQVTDWRTHVSGITPKHMTDARDFTQVQEDIAQLLDGRVLVGHSVRNDLLALLLSHPRRNTRDTAMYPPYKAVALGGTPKLKILAAHFLGLEIQGSAHSSVEDARATMMLFRRDKDGFEREHSKKYPVRVDKLVKKSNNDGEKAAQEKKKKKPKRKKRSNK